MSTTDGLKRGMEVLDTGKPISMPVGDGVMGRVFDVTGNPVDERGPVAAEKYMPDPPPGPDLDGPIHHPADPDDRHQGHRPHLPVPEGRQGRRVRRRRRRQDGRHHGADQQHRQAARRRLRVRRRRRAHPRRQRPLHRNVRGRRHQPEGPQQVQDRPGLWPDERAARRPPARRPLRLWPSPSISATTRTRTCCSSSTTSSASPRPVPRCPRCWGARPAPSVTSRRSPPKWATCRNASPPPRRARSPASRRCMCRRTT